MSTNLDELKNKIAAGQEDAVIMEPTIVARIHQVNDALTSLLEENPDSEEILRAKVNMLEIVDEIDKRQKKLKDYREFSKNLSSKIDTDFAKQMNQQEELSISELIVQQQLCNDGDLSEVLEETQSKDME